MPVIPVVDAFDFNLQVRLKSLRGQLGWNQSKLAKESGVTPAAINMIESGKRVPTVAVMQRISAAFGLTVSELIGEVKISESDCERFYRKFGVLDQISGKDQEILLYLANRLRRPRHVDH